jgi:hypothetical protein
MGMSAARHVNGQVYCTSCHATCPAFCTKAAVQYRSIHHSDCSCSWPLECSRCCAHSTHSMPGPAVIFCCNMVQLQVHRNNVSAVPPLTSASLSPAESPLLSTLTFSDPDPPSSRSLRCAASPPHQALRGYVFVVLSSMAAAGVL